MGVTDISYLYSNNSSNVVWGSLVGTMIFRLPSYDRGASAVRVSSNSMASWETPSLQKQIKVTFVGGVCEAASPVSTIEVPCHATGHIRVRR